MDLSAEVKKRFNLQQNGNGSENTIAPEAPKKKVISQEEIDVMIGGTNDMLHELEEKIFEEGYAEDSINLVYQALQKIFTDKIKTLKGETVQQPVQPAAAQPSGNGSARHEAPAPEEKKQDPQKNLLDYIYDFETFPPLDCFFLGAGPNVMAEGRPLRTWKVRQTDSDKTEWLIPQWAIFSEPQGSFLGFPREQPEKYIYHMEFKGVQKLAGNQIKFMVQIMKKFPG